MRCGAAGPRQDDCIVYCVRVTVVQNPPERSSSAIEPRRGQSPPFTAGFHHLFVYVVDLDATVTFYRDIIGLDVTYREPGYVRLGGADGFMIGFEQRATAHVGAAGVEIDIAVDDVDIACAHLRACGVRVDADPEDAPWGARHLFLRDPSGYRVSLFTPLPIDS